jgi:hypothetical protein
VRKEVQDVWNQVHLLWPNFLGKPTKAGDVSFDFRREYCLSEPNEYAPSGRVFFGARPEKLPDLRQRLADRVFHIGESDILEFLPKLTAKPAIGGPRRQPQSEWVGCEPRDSVKDPKARPPERYPAPNRDCPTWAREGEGHGWTKAYTPLRHSQRVR